MDKCRIREITIKFGDAFNQHDIDTLGACLDENSVFYTLAGEDLYGNKIEGRDNICKAFAGVFDTMKDAHWTMKDVFVSETDNKALSNWIFTGTNADGSRVEAEGCDILTFQHGKIIEKNAFRKQRSLV